VNDLSMKGTAF